MEIAVCWRMDDIVKGMPGGMLVKFGWTDRKINFGAEQIQTDSLGADFPFSFTAILHPFPDKAAQLIKKCICRVG